VRDVWGGCCGGAELLSAALGLVCGPAAKGDNMRALVVRQPWSGRIASGRKTIELRSWTTRYRGPVIIVAGSKPWGKLDPDGPLGVVVCVVDLVDVRPAAPDDEDAAGIAPPDGWFAWVLENPRPVKLAPAKGRLGLYHPEPALVRAAGRR
jgi:hypothetical protein